MSDLQQDVLYLGVDWQLLFTQLPVSQAEHTHITCRLVLANGHECGVILQADRDIVAIHLRSAHDAGGEGKELKACVWNGCRSRPIQHRAMIRHVLSVHLGLLRWACPRCFRRFARKWTKHRCHHHGYNEA